MQKHDPALDTLLDLDGITLVVDPEGGHWVRFVVTRVPVTAEKRMGWIIRLHCTEGMESGWWGSTTLIQWGSRNAASRRIIVIASGRFGRMTIATRLHCSPISGRKWMRC